MSAPPMVRQAVLADVEALAPLFDRYRQFYAQAADLALARQFLSERLTLGESVLLIAEDLGRALGFCQLYPMFSSVRARRIWILNDLFVIDSARRRGVGEALLLAAEAFAVRSGALRMALETGIENVAAQRVYERLGWQAVTQTRWYEKQLR